MAQGLVVMEWNDRSGTDVILKSPESVKINLKELLQVISIHKYSRERGVTGFSDDSKNILSYYAGPETNLYFILILTSLDDPDDFEERLEKVSNIILDNLDDGGYKKLLPSLLTQLSIKME